MYKDCLQSYLSWPKSICFCTIATIGYLWYTTVPSKTKKFGGFKELVARTGQSPAYDENYYPGSEYAELPFGKIHYYLFGPPDGRKLVWISGITTPPTGATLLLRTLANHGYRILTYDHYGRGYSDSPGGIDYTEDLYVAQLALLLAKICWSKVTLLGVSMGGGIAAAFISKFPHLVEKLVLICPAGLMEGLPPISRILSIPIIGDIVGFTLGRRLMLANTEPRLTGEPDKDDIVKLNDKIVRQQLWEHPGFMRAYLSTVKSFPFTCMHAQFEAAGAGRDVLVVWGTADTVVPYRCTEKIMQIIPHAKLKTIEGGTHAIGHDYAVDVAGTIIEFLDNIVPHVVSSPYMQMSWITV